VKEVVADSRRFNREVRDAWTNHVDE